MADKFPNLPGVVVNVTDGNLAPDIAPAGPAVVVSGISGKGPARSLTRVRGGGAASRNFGLSGNLGRGLIEAVQGGSRNTLAYRVLTKPGKLLNIGSGLDIASVVEGSGVFDDLGVIYKHATGALKVIDTSVGVTVYDSVAGTDLGIVSVSGAAVAAAANHLSIGKRVPLDISGEGAG
jgi:hypothetical protein